MCFSISVSNKKLSCYRPNDDPASNAYFRRPYCIQELKWAQEAGKYIQPIIRTQDKDRIGEFLSLLDMPKTSYKDKCVVFNVLNTKCNPTLVILADRSTFVDGHSKRIHNTSGRMLLIMIDQTMILLAMHILDVRIAYRN